MGRRPCIRRKLSQVCYDHCKWEKKLCCIRKSARELIRMLECMEPKKKEKKEEKKEEKPGEKAG